MTVRDFAKERTSVSAKMNGRTKLETRDVIGEELTIIDFDIINSAPGETYGLVIFKEYPEQFLFTGKVLTALLVDIAENYDGIDHAVEMINSEGGLKIKMSTQKTKKKDEKTGLYYQYTTVEIL